MPNKRVEYIKEMIGGMSKVIEKESTESTESTEPYHKFESWLGEMENYVKGVMYEKNERKNDYSKNVEKEEWWEKEGESKGESSKGESSKGESSKGESSKGESSKGESSKGESSKGEWWEKEKGEENESSEIVEDKKSSESIEKDTKMMKIKNKWVS